MATDTDNELEEIINYLAISSVVRQQRLVLGELSYKERDDQIKQLEAEAITAILAWRDRYAKPPVKSRSITDWWITTEFFAQGGKKVAGPFKSRKTAINARTVLEKKSSTTYAIDSTKRKKKRPTNKQGGKE